MRASGVDATAAQPIDLPAEFSGQIEAIGHGHDSHRMVGGDRHIGQLVEEFLRDLFERLWIEDCDTL